MDLSIRDARVRLAGRAVPDDARVDPAANTLVLDGATRAAADLAWSPPVEGTVYGALLNFRDALAALGDAVHRPPYKAPPEAPVLFVKPRNTLSAHGRPVVVPAGVAALAVGASLAVVIGRVACRVAERDALGYVAGYTIANDVTIPHDELYRPAVRLRCRDGFCPLGPWVVGARYVPDPDALSLRVTVDGTLRQEASLRGLVRPVARLLADVTEFMTLQPGDVLLAGTPGGAPRVRAGERVAIAVAGVGTLENPFVAEGAP